MLNNLPDSLLFQILLNIPTKDVVKSSVLSSRWRNLWKDVPGLDLDYGEFQDYNTFESFVNRFLDFDRESSFERFTLRYYCHDDKRNIAHVKSWVNTVVNRKVKHLDVSDYTRWYDEVQIPPTVYTCESLVSLKLSNVILADPKSISLPFVKFIILNIVHFANDLALEKLISSCRVLESLTITRNSDDDINVLRVRSQSLLRFRHVGYCADEGDKSEVAIDAPRLKFLSLIDHKTARFRIKNSGSLVQADINIIFNIEKLLVPNDLPEINMIRDFLVGISSVRKMSISSHTLKVIYVYSRCELPTFQNLSFFYADFKDHSHRLELLPHLLQSCPNLKSLVVEFKDSPEMFGFGVSWIPKCFSSSLEYVKIEKPITGEAKGMNLVSYFLENSAMLKILSLCLDNSIKNEESVTILKKLLTIPRLSTSCQVVVS